MKRLWILLPAVLFLAACGGYSSPSKSKPASGTPIKTISISEKEYSLTPSSIHVSRTGTYAFKVTNNGTIGHALAVDGHGVNARAATIDPGSSAVLKVNLTLSGSYDVYCPIDSHKSQGMKASLTVGGAGGAMTTTGQTTSTNSGTPGY